jgi:hypothetical protein
MQEFVLGETDRIDKFKIALYNLDCWQILNRPFVIPDSGLQALEALQLGAVWDLSRLGS